MKRGLNSAEAMEYLGMRRRTFESTVRPHLTALRLGTSLVFDVQDLDRVFDEMKQQSGVPAVDDAEPGAAQNARWNGRPVARKGEKRWAETHGASTPTKRAPGRSTSTGEALDFASAASRVLRKRTGG